MVEKIISSTTSINSDEFIFLAFSPIPRCMSIAVDVVNHQMQQNSIAREDFYDILVNGLAWAMHHRPFSVLSQLAMDYKTGPLPKRELIKKLLNDEKIIKRYSTCFIYENPSKDITHVLDILPEVYSEEVALKILTNKAKDKLFLVLGCHPVLAKHVDLQVKWINYFVDHPPVSRYLDRFFVSGKALDAVSVEVAFEFIRRLAGREDSSLRKLDLEAVKRVITTYVVAYGKNADVDYVLSKCR